MTQNIVVKHEIQGNIIDNTWYYIIVNSKGRANLSAITILSYLVYWFQPTKDGKRKYKKDLPQISYKQMEEALNIGRHALTDGLKILEKLNIVKRVFRNLVVNGMHLSNVLFIQINFQELKKLEDEHKKTKGVISSNELGGSFQHCKAPPPPPGKTNTKITHRIQQEQQHIEPDKPAVVVSFDKTKKKKPNLEKRQIYPCLANMNPLPKNAQKLTDSFEEKRVALAVAFAQHPRTEIKTTIEAVLHWHCSQEKPPEQPKTEEELKAENLAISKRVECEVLQFGVPKVVYESIPDYNPKQYHRFNFEVCGEYVLVGSNYLTVNYKDRNFKNKVGKEIHSYKQSCLEYHEIRTRNGWANT